MPSIDEVVAKIAANPAPLLFLDTCVLLDVIRAPRRISPETVEAARDVMKAVGKSPATIHLAVGSPTPTEWAAHHPDVLADNIKGCDDAVQVVNSIALTWANFGRPLQITHPQAGAVLSQRLFDLAEDLYHAAEVMDVDPTALTRAHSRIVLSMRPAKAGGKGAKDAFIVEEALALAGRLRGAGIAARCVFISSNTNDFAAPGMTSLHPDLAHDFGTIALEYRASLAAAVAYLKGQGWTP